MTSKIVHYLRIKPDGKILEYNCSQKEFNPKEILQVLCTDHKSLRRFDRHGYKLTVFCDDAMLSNPEANRNSLASRLCEAEFYGDVILVDDNKALKTKDIAILSNLK